MNDAYYRHSGEWPLPATLLALVTGCVAGAVLSAAYAYAILYIPIAGYITFILTAGFGLGTGAVAGLLLKSAKVRNNTIAAVAGVVVGALACWGSWVFWIYALLHRADVDAPLAALALRPSLLWETIAKVNEVGAWNIHGATPTGALLWALWGVEALIIFGGSAFASFAVISDAPFCESCSRWSQKEAGVCKSASGDIDELRPKLEAKSFAAIEQLGKVKEESSGFYRFDLRSCPRCHQTNTLTLQAVKIELKNGKAQTSEKALVDHLLLTEGEALALKEIGRKLA